MSEDNSLRVIVRKNPYEAPLLDTKESSTIEIRDSDGNLAALILTMPGHPVYIVSKSQDQDFETFVKNVGVALKTKE